MSSPDNPQFDAQAPFTTEPPSQPVVTEAMPQPIFPASAPAFPPLVKDPVWNGWDVLQIAALAAVSVIVLQLVIVFGAKFLIYRDLVLKEVAQKVLLAIVAQFVAYVVVAAYMFSLVEGKYRANFWPAIKWNWPRGQWKFLGLGGLVLIALNILGHFLPMPKSTPFEDFFARPSDAYLMSIFAVTFGPFMEELFFRGFLYPVIARRMGIFWGVVLTALPFGLMHMFQYGYAWGVVLLIFLMGVVCTVVRAVTGSVAASFLVHVGYNATEMLIFAVATDGFRHMEKAGALLF